MKRFALRKLLRLVRGRPAARKPLPREERRAANRGERQAAPTIDGIRADHVARYRLALDYIRAHDRVLDIACGVGYGSHLIATSSACARVTAIDRSPQALAYARQHYQAPTIDFIQADCVQAPLPAGQFDVAVSFETVEHLPDDVAFIKQLHAALRPAALLLLSTPNQQHLPYAPDRFPHHQRHYTPDAISALLQDHGFRIQRVFAQPDNSSAEIIDGWDGWFNIIVALREGT